MHFMPQTNLADLPDYTHSSVPLLSLFPLLGRLFPLLQIMMFFRATQTPSLLLLEAMAAPRPPLPSLIFVVICFTPRSTLLHLPVASSFSGGPLPHSAFLTMCPLPKTWPVNGLGMDGRWITQKCAHTYATSPHLPGTHEGRSRDRDPWP